MKISAQQDMPQARHKSRIVRLLYHVRGKGSTAEAIFTFQAVACRYNPCKAGQTVVRGLDCVLRNHYTTGISTTKSTCSFHKWKP